MAKQQRWLFIGLSLVLVLAVLVVLQKPKDRNPCGKGVGHVLDEAQCVGVTEEALSGSSDDFYRDMDYGVSKNPAELVKRLKPYIPTITEEEAVRRFARGRNNWIVWTAGNDRLWDELTKSTFGNLDLLKTISNHPSLAYSRDTRWKYLGLVNEPCFKKGNGPRADRYGLWLDERAQGCQPDPFENAEQYKGVPFGERGKNVALGSYYGYATGIVGLRLFTNPAFDKEAEKKWDPVRFYTDPTYYNNKDLVRPYRVGMSCGFCHVGPNPSNPPQDFENPEWANLNSNPGAQYFWVDRILLWDNNEKNYLKQLFHTSKPGALDTSLVSTDYINNPRTMNAVYSIGPRLEVASKWGKEQLKGGELNNKQFNDYLPEGNVLNSFFDPKTGQVLTPRVLKDGADSVGPLGALNRVFINIGLFSEEWLFHFNPVAGGKPISPMPIATLDKNSTYWRANESQTIDLAVFFIASATPDYLSEAPKGPDYMTQDQAQLSLGKQVFADTCARCHSSKLPSYVFEKYFPDQGCVNENYLKCWNDYWKHTKTEAFKTAMRDEVMKPDFLDNNFLSTELRIPVSLLETNLCSPLARNALKGDIWDNFSSSSYKALPSVGTLQVQNPFSGELTDFEMPAGGRGYTRVPSLISVWSTAPYFVNNNLGPFDYRGTVEGRMESFATSIERLLWPEKRGYSGKDDDYEYSYPFEVITKSGKTHPGYIQMTSQTSYLSISKGFLPDLVQSLEKILVKKYPKIFTEDGITVGPIPKGIPVNLLYHIDLNQFDATRVELIIKLIKDLKALPENATDEQARKVFSNLVEPLLRGSTCPDFVANKGHYFGTEFLPGSEGETPLNDSEKLALIEFLKTM